MFLARRIARRFVTINMRPIKKAEKAKQTWAQLMFSSTMYAQYNIPRILKGQPRIESLIKETEFLDPNEEWFIADMLKMMSLCASQGYFSSTLMEDLHRFLVTNANSTDLLDQDIFFSLSEFLDIRSNIPVLKNARIQAYSRLYNKLDPYQRQIIFNDYVETFRTGQFTNTFILNLDKQTSDFKPIELPNRDTSFQYLLLRIKNRLGMQNVVNDQTYWSEKQLDNIEKLIEEYLSILQDKSRLQKLVRYYQSSQLFLSGLHAPLKPTIIEQYKQRLAQIITTMYSPQNYGLLLPKDQNIQSVIISNFSRNDRLLLKDVLLYICQLNVNRAPAIKVQTLMLMQYCSYSHAGFILVAFKSFYNKLKSISSVSRYFQYKPSREVLAAAVLLQKLRVRSVLNNLIPASQFTDFVDLFILALRNFIFMDRSSVSIDYIVYKNIMLQYLNPGKYNSSSVQGIAKYPQNFQRLINNQRSLGISQSVDYFYDLRLENQKPQLGIFILQLEALQTMLLWLDEDKKNSITVFKQMANSILQMKTSLNYICLPRVYDTFIRIKTLINKYLKNFDWSLLDKQTSNRVKMQFNDTWNMLESLSQKYKKTFVQDPKYLQYLFEIDPSFSPPLLNCGKSNAIFAGGINVNFQNNFTCTQHNILQNAATNKILTALYQQSKLKSIIQSILKQKKIRYTKNYVDYPYFADFMIQGVKTIIYSTDYTKLFMGIQNIPTKCYSDSVEYFTDMKYHIISLKYDDLVDGKLKDSVLEELDKIK